MLDFSVTFFFTIINIIILFFILRKILFKPVSKFIAARTKRIQDDIEKAEKTKITAETLRQEYENKLKDIQTESSVIIRSARVDARLQAEKIITEAKEEAWRIIENARKRADAEHLNAMALIQAEAAAIVVSAAGRLLQRELTSEESMRQAAMFLQQKGKNS